MLLGVVVLRYGVVDRSGLDVVCFARNILQLPRHRSPRVREKSERWPFRFPLAKSLKTMYSLI